MLIINQLNDFGHNGCPVITFVSFKSYSTCTFYLISTVTDLEWGQEMFEVKLPQKIVKGLVKVTLEALRFTIFLHTILMLFNNTLLSNFHNT